MQISPYTWLLLAGILISFFFWKRRARQDRRLIFIYGAALIGAFFGAKIVYLLAEGWLHFGAADMWPQLAAGKSILGALLGGYVFVELAKRQVGYRQATGDDLLSSLRSALAWVAWDACFTVVVSGLFARRGGTPSGMSTASLAGPQSQSNWSSTQSLSCSSFFFGAENF